MPEVFNKWFQKIPILTPRQVIKNYLGEHLKSNMVKGKYEPKLKFPEESA